MPTVHATCLIAISVAAVAMPTAVLLAGPEGNLSELILDETAPRWVVCVYERHSANGRVAIVARTLRTR